MNHSISIYYPVKLTTCLYLLQVATQLLAESKICKGYGPLVDSLRKNGKLFALTEEQKKLVDEGDSNPQVVRSVRRLVACILLQITKNLFALIDRSDKNEVDESFIFIMTQFAIQNDPAIGQELESSEMFAEQCKAMLTAPIFDTSQMKEMMEKLKNTAIDMGEERLEKAGKGWARVCAYGGHIPTSTDEEGDEGQAVVTSEE